MKIPKATEGEVAEWLKTNDLRLYCERLTIGKARKLFAEETGKMTPAKVFREQIEEACDWFHRRSRRPVRRSCLLTAKQWERMKSATESMLGLIQGRPLPWAVEIVRSVEPCSEAVLMGLPKRLHVWSK